MKQSDRRKPRKTLSVAQRAAVKEMLRLSGKTQEEVAEAFGVSRKTISRIANPADKRPREHGADGRATSVWLTGPELDELDRIAAKNGFRSRSQVFRHLVRSAGALTPLDAKTVTAAQDIIHRLEHVATDIEQAVHAGNQGRSSLTDHDRKRMDLLSQVCTELSDNIRDLQSELARPGRIDLARSADNA